MEIIENFLNQYNKQYDFYTELSKIGHNKLESELRKRGIKAIVSYRAKGIDRLREKLVQRNEEKKYKNVQAVFDDIVDLAGVRVALYFPSERDLVDEIVRDLFKIVKTKNFPESSHKPKHTKRFSGYWATHYRVEINKSDKENKRYHNAVFEIQVASVLMHAWSEVEHDLVYKPLSGSLWDEELAILDEINGLVLTGEIALERLQKAMTKRTKESKEISNRYELTNFITNSLNKNYISKLKLGDTKVLNNYLKNIYNYDIEAFTEYLNNINQSVDETISDQLLNMFIRDYYKEDIKDKSLKNYFSKMVGPNKDTSGFESFVKTWIVLEKSFTEIMTENNVIDRTRKYNVPQFDMLYKLEILNKREIGELKKFRRIRNQVLHGVESPNDNFLSDAYLRLREITMKIINGIQNEQIRNEILVELNGL